MADQRCENCRFWAEPTHGNALTGECRAHPPAYSTVVRTIWPHTASDDWCGEFQPREDQDHDN